MAVTVYEIPLSPVSQQFTIPLGGEDYLLRFVYRAAPDGGWTLDISTAFGEPIIHGVPLVAGVDLLEQYEYLGIPGHLIVHTPGARYAVPTYTTLGVSTLLLYSLDGMSDVASAYFTAVPERGPLYIGVGTSSGNLEGPGTGSAHGVATATAVGRSLARTAGSAAGVGVAVGAKWAMWILDAATWSDLGGWRDVASWED